MTADPRGLDVVGLDVGGTKIAAGAMVGGELGERIVSPTPQTGPDAVIAALEAAVESVRTPSLAAVGIGIPSIVEWQTGRVRTSVNITLADVHLREVLEERLGVPVFVDNDANVAALAEASEGARIVVRHLVILTVGTGVGGGIVVNHRVYRGATGAAAELGHTLIAADLRGGAPPSAPRPPHPGSLELEASGRALGRLAAAHGFADGRAVVLAARAGDETARGVVTTLGQRLGIGVANVITTFEPDVVVLGGGVAEAAGELLLEPAVATARRFLIPGVGEHTEIRLARYGNDAGVRGAALLAAHELTDSA
jgi:glucokinase